MGPCGAPGIACRDQADSTPRAKVGVMDWRIEAMKRPWKDWEVISGFESLKLRDVEGRVTSCSTWNIPLGWVDDVFHTHNVSILDIFSGRVAGYLSDYFGDVLLVDTEMESGHQVQVTVQIALQKYLPTNISNIFNPKWKKKCGQMAPRERKSKTTERRRRRGGVTSSVPYPEVKVQGEACELPAKKECETVNKGLAENTLDNIALIPENAV
jgi:hypothetical protein